MNLRRFAFRGTNRLLSHMGLELVPIPVDFQARLLSEKHLDRMFATIAKDASSFLSSQKLFAINRKFDVEAEVRRFYDSYLGTPFRHPSGGSRFGNLLWLNLIAKSLQPDVIVDSGTYKGASSWAMCYGAPDAKTLSFDIDLSRLDFRSKNVEYIERDWATYNFDPYQNKTCLVYFDDHLDQGKRLKEAADRKFQVAIFDDDFSIFSFAPFAHGGLALPKISFFLDNSLEDGDDIQRVQGEQQFSLRVDRAKWDTLRALIGATERLPNLAALLGIDQLPYRVVGIKQAPPGVLRQDGAA